jgi:hypothetical protein
MLLTRKEIPDDSRGLNRFFIYPGLQFEGQISADILERLKVHIKSLHKALVLIH